MVVLEVLAEIWAVVVDSEVEVVLTGCHGLAAVAEAATAVVAEELIMD